MDDRVQSLVQSFVPADGLDRDLAQEVAQGVLLQGCRDAHVTADGTEKDTLPSPYEIKDWDRAGFVAALLETLGQVPHTWSADVARAIVHVGFNAVAPRTFLDTPDVERLVGFAYALGVEAYRHHPEAARRWLESDLEGGPMGALASTATFAGSAATSASALADDLDIGLEALRQMHGRLQIEESWTVREPRSFTWVAHRLAQTVHASEMFASRGLRVSVVTVTTTVTNLVQQRRETLLGFLADFNMLAVGSGYQLDETGDRLIAISRHAVHAETFAARVDHLSDFSLLQLCLAEHHADSLANSAKGAVAAWEHPTSGPRLVPDEMLGVVGDLFVPAGLEASRFADAREMRLAEDMVRGTPFASVGSSADGLCVEVAFGEHNTTLIQVSSAARHPNLGAGLGVATVLPLDLPEDELIERANYLQLLQSETVEGGGQFGAWAVRRHISRPCVAYCRFVPNAMFGAGVIQDVVLHEISRALWVDGLCFPDLPPRNAWEIMGRRNGTSVGGDVGEANR